MNLFESNQSEFAWWVEINTIVPCCTYYFGPFDSEKEAQLSRSGYVEDLYQEGASKPKSFSPKPPIYFLGIGRSHLAASYAPTAHPTIPYINFRVHSTANTLHTPRITK